MEFAVRRLEPEDWREFRQLRLEALQAAPLAFVEQYAESVAEPDEYWQDRVRQGATDATMATFVATHDGHLVGKASGFMDDKVVEPTVHLFGVYVTPDFRGSGLGVSGAVVGAVIRWARDAAGAEQVRLFVTEINSRAEAFYRRLGFERSGATMAYPPDPSITEYEMTHSELAVF
ncbi:hypothetical protein Rhe02_48790 [Rhizocola hellebori]|uniref:N-acetyltransferase domain-containing protein n=1 Tax=Rhizocola hellebori TaxID=1392758 RepID=A0A8J3QBH6_9ACTN|nr:GNAT family N-acetyltransferase [Rhizocola hellebori]GIH06812.1 hypothetical protein Rhe02_48790 [Rhizocola hellebori]